MAPEISRQPLSMGMECPYQIHSASPMWRYPPGAVSGGGCNQVFVEYFGWILPVEGLAWSSVEF
ncbi:hypothetical protein, partial [Micromonospora luteifusca]|uniref:hypothetical protein n=1 Tax=Micromonospora luteifusca TaxID=709860 RepID=UPI0033B00B76